MQNVALQLKIPKGAPSNPNSFPFEAESIPMPLTPLQSNTTPIPTTLVTPQSKIFGLSNLRIVPIHYSTSVQPCASIGANNPEQSAAVFSATFPGNMGNPWDGFDSESSSKSLAHESAMEHGDWANSCTGQLIQWLPGLVWDLYAYHQHTDNSLPWTLISIEDSDWIQIWAKRCNFLLHTELEQNRRACVPCQKLANSAEFKQFMSNASKDPKQFTPIRCLNQRQLRQMYLSTHKRFNDLKLISLNSAQRIKSLRKRVTKGQQLCEDGYPSWTTLYHRKNIPKLRMSVGIPNAIKINKSIETFLGSITGRQGPETLSCEHSGRADDVKQTVDTIQDLNNLANALKKDMIHHGKDGTVLGLAPISADENYFDSSLVLSGSCKSETRNNILIWITMFVQCYYSSPHGRMRHSDLTNIATDGKSSFRKMRFLFGYTEDLDCESKLGELLYQLPSFNCQTGIYQIITTCNPKHISNRNPNWRHSDNRRTYFEVLTRWGKMPRNKAHQLLQPADKQNVPKAVNLLQSLFDLEKLKLDWEHLLLLWKHFHVEMSLAHQIQSISTFAHLITAMFQKHKTSFLTSTLISDLQAIAKSTIFNTTQLQIVDPESRYYILFKGTDRLEGVFSHAWTQDHAHNFDTVYSNLRRSLVLAPKLTLFSNVTQIWTAVIFAATLPKPKVRAASGSEEEHLEPDVSEFKDPQGTLGPGSGKYDNATIEPMEETLNPEMERNATHYIIFKGRQLFKPKLISRQLSSDSARKVTIWPLCAQGVSVLEMLNRWLQVLNQSQEDGTKANTVKVGDLGAALTRVGNNVCLAIVEVLNFRQTKSKNINLTAVDMNDLDFASKTGTTIAVQILNLAPAPSANKPLTWIWTQKYIQLQPRMLFFLLGPDVIYEKNSDNPQWSLKDTELKEVDLPPEINLAKKDGKDEIKHFICTTKTQLCNMQKHVGKHILLALQRFQDQLVKAGREIWYRSE
ncbi:hypothetical protein B0H34DRAFT_671570 [Crassisporium funariophilum]|nr:hypothetical protein B0H34DRAFT_671570 [Crassisporium funariophilum]